MDEELRDDVYVFFAGSRYNVEVMFPGSDESGYVCNVRVKPWKSTGQGARMVLVAGPTVDDALLLAVQVVNAGGWEPLDFAARMWHYGVYTVDVARAATSPNGKRAMLRPELSMRPGETKDTRQGANEAQKPVQLDTANKSK